MRGKKMEATAERTVRAEEEIDSGAEAERLVKEFRGEPERGINNEWWTVEFKFADESVYVYRTTFYDFIQVWANKSAKKRGRYIAVEREVLEELDVYLPLEACWAESGRYGEDEQKLVATAMAGAFAGEELQRLYAEEEGKAEIKADSTTENESRIYRLWDWKQKLGGMIELAVRKAVRWMR